MGYFRTSKGKEMTEQERYIKVLEKECNFRGRMRRAVAMLLVGSLIVNIAFAYCVIHISLDQLINIQVIK